MTGLTPRGLPGPPSPGCHDAGSRTGVDNESVQTRTSYAAPRHRDPGYCRSPRAVAGSTTWRTCSTQGLQFSPTGTGPGEDQRDRRHVRRPV
jgi:hypothetical protein